MYGKFIMHRTENIYRQDLKKDTTQYTHPFPFLIVHGHVYTIGILRLRNRYKKLRFLTKMGYDIIKVLDDKAFIYLYLEKNSTSGIYPPVNKY